MLLIISIAHIFFDESVDFDNVCFFIAIEDKCTVGDLKVADLPYECRFSTLRANKHDRNVFLDELDDHGVEFSVFDCGNPQGTQ